MLIGGCASEGNRRPPARARRQADGGDGPPSGLRGRARPAVRGGADIKSLGVSAFQSDPEDVQARFGPALAAQPMHAETFVLYFVEGRDEFTEESKRLVDTVVAEVARRPVPDVLVVGHTDAVGSDQVNDALGLRRAETVRAALIAAGVPASDVQAISRGRRAPAVMTADGVAEPRNRRVEIIVR